MSLLNVAAKQLTRIYQNAGSRMLFVGCTHRTEKIIDRDDDPSIIIPVYQEKVGESLDVKKARLLYQSRKRGMLENGLLLSTFASKYLDTMSEEQTAIYDKLINVPSNDWEIFYWATGVKPTPKEYDTEIMDLLKSHVRNEKKESRIKQPDLYT